MRHLGYPNSILQICIQNIPTFRDLQALFQKESRYFWTLSWTKYIGSFVVTYLLLLLLAENQRATPAGGIWQQDLQNTNARVVSACGASRRSRVVKAAMSASARNGGTLC